MDSMRSAVSLPPAPDDQDDQMPQPPNGKILAGASLPAATSYRVRFCLTRWALRLSPLVLLPKPGDQLDALGLVDDLLGAADQVVRPIGVVHVCRQGMDVVDLSVDVLVHAVPPLKP